MNKNIYTPTVGIFTSNEISRYYRRICENLNINNIVFYEFNQVNKNLDFSLFDHENQIESVNDYSNIIDSNLKDLKFDYNFSKLEIEKTIQFIKFTKQVDLTNEKVVENYNAFMTELKKSKPTGAKGVFIKKISMSSTMGMNQEE